MFQKPPQNHILPVVGNLEEFDGNIIKKGINMGKFELTPKVDETQEFIEIANDFSNPLELVREAISNSYDAKATEIKIKFIVENDYGEALLKIEIEDNGSGMDNEGLQSFFDLGNSLRRKDKDSIGEKGHGTKVYFNSKRIEVTTWKDGTEFIATMDVFQPPK